MISPDANSVELTRHSLPRSVFDQICAGRVDSAGVAFLRNCQHSLRRLRLRTFAQAATEMAGFLGPFAAVDDAWNLLARAERASPSAVEDVLMYPTVGVWLSRGLRRVLGVAVDTTPLWTEVGGFYTVAAAAAYRCDLTFEIAVPVIHGVVNLPTVGVLRVPMSFPVGHAVLRNDASGLSITVFDTTVETTLEPVVRHTCDARGQAMTIVLDDVDPYRDFVTPIAPNPLSHHVRAEWRKLLDEAWDMLTSTFPASADELAAGLINVVPIDATEQIFAASSAAAFGSIAMPPKESSVELAEALVHEIQHSKVNSLLDLVTLADDDQEPRYYAPWMDEPRPVTALLHGVYAFCSVVEYWWVQHRHVPAALARRALFAYGLRYQQVDKVLMTLRRIPHLTELGRKFAVGVSGRLAACGSVDLPADVSEAIAHIAADHRVVWRIRHLQPDEDAVDALATAWLNDQPPRQIDVPSALRRSSESGRTTLSKLAKLRATDPELYAHRWSFSAETTLLDGNTAKAARLFSARVQDSPHDAAAWSGLALALNSRALQWRPELVRAAYFALTERTTGRPDPGQLAVWLDTTAS